MQAIPSFTLWQPLPFVYAVSIVLHKADMYNPKHTLTLHKAVLRQGPQPLLLFAEARGQGDSLYGCAHNVQLFAIQV